MKYFSALALTVLFSLAAPVSSFSHPLNAQRSLVTKLSHAEDICSGADTEELCQEGKYCFWHQEKCKLNKEQMIDTLLKRQMLTGVALLSGVILTIAVISNFC